MNALSNLGEMAWAGLILLASLAVGHLVLSRWRNARLQGVDQLIVSSGLGLGILAYATLAIGLLGGIYRPVVYAVVLVPVLLYGRGVLDMSARLVRFARRSHGWSEGWAMPALVGFLVLAAVFNLVGALAPPTGNDVQTYHFALPEIWVRHHEVSYIDSLFASGWPSQIQMLYTLAITGGGFKAAQLLNWGMGILAVLTLYRLGRVWLAPLPALLGCAIFYAITDVSYQSAQGGVDLAGTAFLLLSLLALVRWSQTRSEPWFWLMAVFAGFFAATKLNHVIGPMAMAPVVLLVTLRYVSTLPRNALWRAALFGLVAFVMVLPWYLRSWIATGNPVFPFLTGVFGGRGDLARSELVPDVGVGEAGTLVTLLRAPWDYTMRTGEFSGGVIGPLYLSFLPLAVVVLIRRPFRTDLAVAMAVFALLFTLMWNGTYPVARGLFPVLALASIPTALVAMAIARQSRLGMFLVIAALGFWLTTGLVGNLRFHASAAPVAAGLKSDAEFLGDRFCEAGQTYTEYPVWTYLNEHLPLDSKVLIDDQRGLYLERDYVTAWAMARGLVMSEALENPRLMRDELERLGITHVAFHLPSGDRLTVTVRPAVTATGCLEPYYKFGTTEVYHVDYTRCIP